MLITGLATVGNPEACFQSGMCLVFGKQRGAIMSCLDPLRRTAEVGHKVAIFALALLLYRPNSGDGEDDEARRLLRMVEGPEPGAPALPWNNKTCMKCSYRIISALWDLASSAVGVRCITRTIISVWEAAVASTQDGMLGTRGAGFAARIVGSATSVIGSSSQSWKC
jgi:hypothetical protein